jgi:hypothetical protein
LQFAIDRIRELAPDNPQWKTRLPFQSIIDDDKEWYAHITEKDLLEIVMVSLAGRTTEQFAEHMRA